MSDINIGQISEALNDKMDRDSNNANPAVAKQSDLATLQATIEQLQATVTNLQGEVSKMLGRIDYSNAIAGITIKEGKTYTYTCPSNGYIILVNAGYSGSTRGSFLINNKTILIIDSTNDAAVTGSYFPVSKGDILNASGDRTSFTITFCPQKS